MIHLNCRNVLFILFLIHSDFQSASCTASFKTYFYEFLIGASILTTEGAIFELLGDAKDKHFKEISGLIKERKGASVNDFSMDTSLF